MSIIGEIKGKKYRPEWISTYEDFDCECKKFKCARKKNKNVFFLFNWVGRGINVVC